MGAIFFLSHQPGDQLPLPALPGIDKLAHFLVYAVLAGCVLYAWGPDWRRERPVLTVTLTLGWCVLFGISDEVHQSLVPGRDPDLLDVLADGAGAAAGCALWLWRRTRAATEALSCGAVD